MTWSDTECWWGCRQMLLRKWQEVVKQEVRAATVRAKHLETRAWLEKGTVIQVHTVILAGLTLWQPPVQLMVASKCSGCICCLLCLMRSEDHVPLRH